MFKFDMNMSAVEANLIIKEQLDKAVKFVYGELYSPNNIMVINKIEMTTTKDGETKKEISANPIVLGGLKPFLTSEIKSVKTNNGFKTVENYTNQIISVGFSNLDSASKELLFTNGLDFNGTNAFISEIGDKGYIAREGYTRYRFLSVSPSQERDGECLMTYLNNNLIINEITGGLLDYYKTKEGIITEKFLPKFSTRLSQNITGHINAFQIGTKESHLALIGSETTGFIKDLIESDCNVKHENNNFADGYKLINAKALRKFFLSKGCNISLAACRKMLLQARANGINDKAGAKAVDEIIIERHIISNTKELKYLVASEFIEKLLNFDDLSAYWTIIAGGKDIAEKDIDYSRIECVADKDCCKALVPQALAKGNLDFYILNIAKSSLSAKMSTQLYNSVSNKLVDDFIIERAIKDAIESINDNNEDLDQIHKALFSINPEKASTTSHFWKKIIHTMENRVKKIIEKLSVSLRGSHEILAPDLSGSWSMKPLLGIREDGLLEAYCPGINSLLDKEDNTGRVGRAIKYPSQGKYEVQDFYFLSYGEMLDKINKYHDIDKKVLISYLNSIGYGTMLIPSVNILKQKLAGLDFDFDSIVVILEELIVKKSVKNVIVDIMNKKEQQ